MIQDHLKTSLEGTGNDKPATELYEVKNSNDIQCYAIDPQDEKKVVWKLDCVLMPLLALIYFFQCQSNYLSAFQ